MITGRDVTRVATETDFRPEVVEKVLRLCGILDRLDRHELTHGTWVLKGGTALNLLYLDVPRLSMDIDINYVGSEDVNDMREARPDFERALTACCEREGCTVRRASNEHAGEKFRLRYPSVLGGSQNLEVDVSYVARIPIWSVVGLQTRFPPGLSLDVPTLTLEELAAGKFAALLQRSAVRDAYDAANLLRIAPDLPQVRNFRIAFLCFIAASRTDARELRPVESSLDINVVARELEPLLRRASGVEAPDRAELAAWIHEKVVPAMQPLLAWSEGERRFLHRMLEFGEIEPEALHEDPEVQDRIRRQPMLLWKTRHIRAHRKKT